MRAEATGDCPTDARIACKALMHRARRAGTTPLPGIQAMWLPPQLNDSAEAATLRLTQETL